MSSINQSRQVKVRVHYSRGDIRIVYTFELSVIIGQDCNDYGFSSDREFSVFVSCMYAIPSAIGICLVRELSF